MRFSDNSNLSAFEYRQAEVTWSNHYLWPVLRRIIEGRDGFMFFLMRAMYQAIVAVKKYDARRNLG